MHAEPGPGRSLRPDDGRLLRGSRSRARIREAARSLFLERGFDGATLRAIAQRAGMGASSIYRHVRSKEELLVEELAELQEQAWTRFRREDERAGPTLERVRRFLRVHHALLAERPDLTTVAVRATTHPGARVARQALAIEERGVGLLVEILQGGRVRGDVARELDLVEAARVLFRVAAGARIAWANGLVDAADCLAAAQSGATLVFQGLAASP
jgi:AcrR family transcriptional regulator